MRIGSLFSGFGGLDLGVREVLGGEVVWHVEFDPAPSKILAHHWPDIPNYGDITAVDWSQVPPVDVLTGGFPCQDVSLAGARAGLKDGTRSGLWSEFAKAVDILRPRLVVIENVRGLLSAKTIEETDETYSDMESEPGGLGRSAGNDRPVLNAFGRVLGDLAQLGYDTQWVGVRAADAGAPHGRYRVFIIAQPANTDDRRRGEYHANFGRLSITDANSLAAANPGGDESERWGVAGDVGSTQAACESREEERQRVRNTVSDCGSTAAHPCCVGGHESDHATGFSTESANRASVADECSPRSGATQWGQYEPAIRRWEQVTGRQAPPPTNADGKNDSHRLSAQFVEWMQGLELGHVTDPAIGLTRNQQLKALGNGVVPQQAALALRMLGVSS